MTDPALARVPWERRRWVPAVVIAIALAVVWWSPFDHPLYPHDEGRYAAVAAHMVDSGDWIVPVFRGEVHLTKPPLTYWLEALSVTAFGRTEAAARMPAMLATTSLLLLVFAFMRAQRGTLTAVVAVGMYAVMPLALVVGRIGATDAILNLWWTTALIAGYLAIERDQGRWRFLFWLAIALAALTKGPLAIAPIGILGTWLALSGRVRQLWRLGWYGAFLAPLPLVAWILAVRAAGHDLLGIWWMESFGRASGSLGKHEPWWLYIPIFLIGFFPATAMLTLPWFNLGPRQAWAALRAGSLEALLVMAVVVPFLVFSAASGKLPTYILPLAPPLAMLVAGTLRRWIDGAFDAPIAGFKPPDVRITVTICFGLLAIALPAGMHYAPVLFRSLWLPALAFVVPFVVACVGVAFWRRPDRRSGAIAAVWLALSASWIWVFHEEDQLWEPRSQQRVMEAVTGLVGPNARVVVLGVADQTRHFYYAGDVHDLGRTPDWAAVRTEIDQADAVIIDEPMWAELAQRLPDVATHLEIVSTMPAFLGGDVRIARASHRS